MKRTDTVKRIRSIIGDGRKGLDFLKIKEELVSDMESQLDKLRDKIDSFYGEQKVAFKYDLKDFVNGIVTFCGFYIPMPEDKFRHCNHIRVDIFSQTPERMEVLSNLALLYDKVLFSDGFITCYYDDYFVYIHINLDYDCNYQNNCQSIEEKNGMYKVINKFEDCKGVFQEKIYKIMDKLLSEFLNYIEKGRTKYTRKFKEICASKTIGVEYKLDFLKDLDYSCITICQVYNMEELEAHKDTTFFCKSMPDYINSDEDIPFRKRLKLLYEYLKGAGIDECYMINEDTILLTLNV